MHPRASYRSVLARVAAVAGAASWLATTTPVRAEGIDAIAAYAGTWTLHAVEYDPPGHRARSVTTTFRNVCWRSAAFFACDQLVGGSPAALIVFTYDRVRRIYHIYTVPLDGGRPGTGTLLVRGHRWTFPWQDTGANVRYYRVVNTFVNPRTIRYRREFSRDDRRWTVAATGVERRREP